MLAIRFTATGNYLTDLDGKVCEYSTVDTAREVADKFPATYGATVTDAPATAPVTTGAWMWGTAKTHGLKAGDVYIYGGRDRKAPAGTGEVQTYSPSPYGGHATRFWARTGN